VYCFVEIVVIGQFNKKSKRNSIIAPQYQCHRSYIINCQHIITLLGLRSQWQTICLVNQLIGSK